MLERCDVNSSLSNIGRMLGQELRLMTLNVTKGKSVACFSASPPRVWRHERKCDGEAFKPSIWTFSVVGDDIVYN